MKAKKRKAPPLTAVKESTITIKISGNEITGIVNDTECEMYSLSKDGFFIMSNYPLTITCGRCNGSGKDGYFGTVKCGECSGSGQVDLYQKKE